MVIVALRNWLILQKYTFLVSKCTFNIGNIIMAAELLEVDDIIREIESISVGNHNSRSGLSFQRSQRVKAVCTSNELEQIYHLVESHVPSLRERTAYRFQRILIDEESHQEQSTEQLKLLKDIIGTKCSSLAENNIKDLVTHVAEMPKEWTIIQLTSQYNSLEAYNIDPKKYHTSGLHISVFNCGQNNVIPFLVTVDPPEVNGFKVNLMQELMDTVAEYKETLTMGAGKKMFKNHSEKINYCLKRDGSDQLLKGIIKKVEQNWLGEWRCLLIGKYQNEMIEELVKSRVDNLINNQLENVIMTEKNKELLYRITKGIQFLRSDEVLKAVMYCLDEVNDQNTIKEFCRSIKEIGTEINTKHRTLLRHPTILVVDECLDSVPWEMLDVLQYEPVSRVPSLHFAYYLFKAHESEIEEGHKIIRNYKKGAYIVNPDRDLECMEARMMAFYNYWLPDWKGIHDHKPTHDEFYDLLINADIFSYNGHGNGGHIMGTDVLQKTHVKAVVLLFGCASTQITQLSPQVEMYGSYHMYLISRCPCVLGMLWEVTDIATDLLTTEFLSNWVPSNAPVPWATVLKQRWKQGLKSGKFLASHKTVDSKLNNPELLRALCHSKKTSEYFFAKAACVVRGLPVKIKVS